MGKHKRTWVKRILAACLAFLLLFCQEGMVWAEATVTAQGTLAEPTEFPAPGYLPINVAVKKNVSEDGETTYDFKEIYLEVLVDANKNVYGNLQTLADYLNMTVHYNGSDAIVSYHDTYIGLSLYDNEAGYYCGPVVVSANMGLPVLAYEEEWYVPLDAFLQLTDSFFFYNGEDSFGKQKLCLVPPQRTILEDLVDFMGNTQTYKFDYINDIGYTLDQAKEVAGDAGLVQYIYSLGAFDPDRGLLTIFSPYSEDDITNSIGTEFIDIYMAHLLQRNEEIEETNIKRLKNTVDFADVFLSLVGPEYKYLEKFSVSNNMKIGGESVSSYFSRQSNNVSAMGAAVTGVGYLISMLSICSALADEDEFMVDAAEDFYENRLSVGETYVAEYTYDKVKRNIDQYAENIAKSAVDEWFQENALDVMLNVAALAEIGYASWLSGFKAIWTGGTQFVLGEWLEQTESYTVGVFGMYYQQDAVNYAIDKILKYVYYGDYESIAGTVREDEIRQAVYHAAKACYVTRYFGCCGGQIILENNPSVRSRQESINKELAILIGRMVDESIPFGKMANDLTGISTPLENHYENVIFNLCQISGQVLSYEDEKPLKGVEIKVIGETGEVLAEFETDEDGWFDQAFVLDEVDNLQENPGQKNLTLHLYYKRNPVILEPITVEYFKNYLIEGLHAGKKTETICAYLNSARVEEGQTIIDITRITIAEDTVYFDIPDWQSGTFKTYAAFPGQAQVAEQRESIQLEEGLVFGSIYSQMMPEGSLVGGFYRMFAQAYGDDSIIPEALLETELDNAEEIQAYIEAYVNINGEYPAYEMDMVNSLVDYLEPVMVVTSD